MACLPLVVSEYRPIEKHYIAVLAIWLQNRLLLQCTFLVHGFILQKGRTNDRPAFLFDVVCTRYDDCYSSSPSRRRCHHPLRAGFLVPLGSCEGFSPSSCIAPEGVSPSWMDLISILVIEGYCDRRDLDVFTLSRGSSSDWDCDGSVVLVSSRAGESSSGSDFCVLEEVRERALARVRVVPVRSRRGDFAGFSSESGSMD